MMRTATRFMLTLLFASVFVGNTSSVFSQAPMKRVLVEEFTGAWCPWCIDGPVRLAQLHDKFGDQVIAVAIHDNDSMTTPEYNAADGLKLMAPFFPAGCVNRNYYADEKTSKIGIDRENWEKRTEEELAKPAVADVKISGMKFNAGTRELSVTVYAKFAQDLTGDLRFNVILSEDGIVGTGTGWDQANAYNALKGSESHPWFGKGSPVKGFIHNHVFRRALGGAWGSAGVIPASVKNGDEFSKTYTFIMPGNWDTDKMSVIAVLQQYDADVNNRRILNSYELEMSSGPTKVLSTGGAAIVNAGKSYNYSFTIVNRSNTEQVYTLFSTKSARTPADWLLVMNGNEKFTLPAGVSQTVTVTMAVGTTVGIGDIESYVVSSAEPDTKYYARNLSILHGGVTAVELITESSKHSIGRQNYLSIDASANQGIYSQLMLLPNLKTVVYNAGESGGVSAANAQQLVDLLDRNVSLLLTGNSLLTSAKITFPSLLTTILGVQVLGESIVGMEGASKVAFTVNGVSTDPISDGMTLNNCMLDESKIQKLYVTGATSKAFLKAGTNESIAMRTQLTTARIVVMPNSSIFGTNKTVLLDKVIAWLESNNSKPQAIMHASSNLLMFGDVEVRSQKSQAITMRNSGALPLVINKIDWQTQDDPNTYTVTPALPITIETGASVDVNFACHPKTEGNVGTSCTIYSNASNTATLAVLIRATGIASTDVEPTVIEKNGITLGVAPNPVSEVAVVRYSTPQPQNVQITIVDIMGNEVQTITNSQFASGEQIVTFNTQTLPSGNYRVVLTSGVASMYVPLIVVR